MTKRVAVLVNPRSGAGRARRYLTELDRKLQRSGCSYELLETRGPGDGVTLARQALAAGCSVLGVMGGDGTLNEAVQAYVDAEGNPIAGPPLAIIPSGTGGDFARGCGFKANDLDGALRRLEARQLRSADLGLLHLHDAAGRRLTRAFINIASAGISGDVDERVERGPKWLGGKWAFLLATIGATFSYRNVPVEITIDGKAWHQGRVLLVALANGQFFGGGMQVAPMANFSDGRLEVVCVGDMTRTQVLTEFPRVRAGTHLDLATVRTEQARTVTIAAAAGTRPILVDVDGETPGYLPLEARILPGALQLCVD